MAISALLKLFNISHISSTAINGDGNAFSDLYWKKYNLRENEMFITILLLIAVGLLWGATNPFIRLAGEGIEKIDTGSKWRNVWLELRMIGSRLNYWIPFLLNQAGSVLYVWTLQRTSITVAVPVANSLSFVFTALAGYLLGEKLPGKNVIIGTVLICVGSTLMIYDKAQLEPPVMEFEFKEDIPVAPTKQEL